MRASSQVGMYCCVVRTSVGKRERITSDTSRNIRLLSSMPEVSIPLLMSDSKVLNLNTKKTTTEQHIRKNKVKTRGVGAAGTGSSHWTSQSGLPKKRRHMSIVLLLTTCYHCHFQPTLPSINRPYSLQNTYM